MPAHVPTQARSEDTRARILQAAEDAFCGSGYDATGVAEICERAGVSKGAFYHHFATKHDAFMALLAGWLGGFDVQFAAARQEEATVPGALLRMASMAGQIFRDGAGQLPMFLEFWTQAARDPVVWKATIEPYHAFRNQFAGMIAEGVEQGSLRPIDAKAGAQILTALALGLVLQGLLDPEGADWAQLTQDGVKVLVEGMKRDA